jgi:hypothetical protein
MPNPPKPNEVKRRIGNPGRRPLPDPKKVTALKMASSEPEPLRHLGEEGQALWSRVWSSGAAWIAPSTDIELVQLLCEAMDERQDLRDVVMAGGSDWRDRVALRNLEGEIKSMLSILAFTPTDRTRLGVGEVRQESKLEALRARRQG